MTDQSNKESPEETSKGTPYQKSLEHWLEVISAIVLGIVAVSTAWSGYQGSRWGGVQALKYSEASAKRVEATRAGTLAGQDWLYDVSIFNEWLDAVYNDEAHLAEAYERRFRSEFWPAFDFWLETDPFNDPSAPPSPLYMPNYKIRLAEQAERLEAEAATAFEEGKSAYQWSSAYVLDTVFLATVLMFITMAQRFGWIRIKMAVLSIAILMLILGLYRLFSLPVY